MTDKKCPCKDCICIPVCRHKPYMNLFHDCILLRRYEPAYDRLLYQNTEHRHDIEETLKPSKWGTYREYYKQATM